ncbi:MAG: hypothetical protein QM775_26490 [Pirellulales bacterium]
MEIWPEQFEAACKQAEGFARAGKLGNRERELVDLYKRYQSVLETRSLYDKEGLFWIVRQLLQDGQREPCDRLDLVVVDGFTDFTRTQLEILDVLAERSASLLITLPDEPTDEREDLFAKLRSTLAQLRKRHPALQLEMTKRRERPDWPALDHVEQELFKSPRRMQPVSDHGGIEFMAASGTVAEVEELARRVKRLLVKGDESRTPARRVKPDEVTIVCRSLGECGTLIREIFTRYGIPIASESGRPLGHSPSITALMALVKLTVDDWPFRDLLAVLGSNYFRPRWQEAASPGVPEATERTIRRMQVPSSRAALLEAIQTHADRPPEEVNPHDPLFAERSEKRNRMRAEALLALPLLRRLGEALDRLPSQASAAAWSTALQALADETGLSRSMNDAAGDVLHSQPRHDFREDYAAWNSFHNVAAGRRPLGATRRRRFEPDSVRRIACVSGNDRRRRATSRRSRRNRLRASALRHHGPHRGDAVSFRRRAFGEVVPGERRRWPNLWRFGSSATRPRRPAAHFHGAVPPRRDVALLRNDHPRRTPAVAFVSRA